MDEFRHKRGIIFYSILGLLMIGLFYVVPFLNFSFLEDYAELIRNLIMSLFIACLIMAISKAIAKLIVRETEDEGTRYNLIRLLNLITLIAIVVVFISFIFQNLYAAATSFGLASLIFGFAMQAPITSFIAWLYIVFRKPYQVGDRIQVNKHRGDVIEITYLDTIIEEVSGDYLGNDRKSGRVIHFPNGILLKDKVVNYSGAMVPFIWNETVLQIAFTSDIQFVEDCLLGATKEDFAERYPSRKEEEEWTPAVYFRNNKYGWFEAVVQYPVEPFDTTGRRNRILKKALPQLNASPEKVQFPEGTRR